MSLQTNPHQKSSQISKSLKVNQMQVSTEESQWSSMTLWEVSFFYEADGTNMINSTAEQGWIALEIVAQIAVLRKTQEP